jgi:peptide deformylase
MMAKNTNVDSELNQAVERLIKSGGKDRILPIVQVGEPVLRQQAVEYNGQLRRRTLHKLIEAMRATMLAAPGVGLAAPQIGLGLAFAVVEDHVSGTVEGGNGHDGQKEDDSSASADSFASSAPLAVTDDADDDDADVFYDDASDPREIAEFPFHVIINPSYEPIGDQTRSFYEGCLSFEGYQAVRRRWLDITARWQDEDGKRHEERLHGWPARIFQHETDHLRGEVYIDNAEIRSLSTDENLEDYWSEDPVPTVAAHELGFSLS